MRTPPLILIVDDNPSSVEILQMRLAANNYDVLTASDGEEGLALAREKQPDLILLDIMMPKLDGVEVCRLLKTDTSLPFMPIIMVTAKTGTKDVVEGLEAGADEYLTKPVDHTALVARVKSMLRIKELHDTVVEQSAQLTIQLKTATRIQSLFWPDIPELKAGSHIWAASAPAKYVGGDLYDVIPLPDESLLAYVADVSDKGVPAALIMAALSTTIRSEARLQSEVDKLLEMVNIRTHKLAAEEGFFATIALVRYWPHNGRLPLAKGGHLPPLWIHQGEVHHLSQASGISLGITPDVRYQKEELDLTPGEALLLYTDGVVEARNDDKELFGSDRLKDSIQGAIGPPRGKALLRALRRWQGNAPDSDDVTLLEIWRE